MNEEKTPIWKIILTDLGGIGCLILVPFLGPLPGPGGIPLLVAGLGLLSVNHDKPKALLHYVKKHSQSVRGIVFPDIGWVKNLWDVTALLLLVGGTAWNFNTEWWVTQALSIGVLASSSTVFLMNRNRIDWLDKKFRSQK